MMVLREEKKKRMKDDMTAYKRKSWSSGKRESEE